MLLRLLLPTLLPSIIHAQVSPWVMRFDGAGDDLVSDVVVDKQGNFIVAGLSQSPTMTIYNSAEQPIRSISDPFSRRIFLANFSSGLQLNWICSFNSTRGATAFAMKSLALDSLDNIIVGMDLFDSLWFTDSRGRFRIIERALSPDGIVVKLSQGGIYQWHTRVRTPDRDFMGSVSVDSKNNILVASWHSLVNSSLEIFNSSDGVNPAVRIPKLMAMLTLVKFDSNGTLLWFVRVDVPSPLPGAISTALAVNLRDDGIFFGSTLNAGGSNPSGSCYVLYDASNVAISEPSNPSLHMGVVWKISSNGTFLWTAKFDGSNPDLLNSMATDPASGDLLLVGVIASPTAVISHTSGNTTLQSTIVWSSLGAVVIRFNPDGALKWYARNRRESNAAENDRAGGLLLDAESNVYFYGTYPGGLGIEIFDSNQMSVSNLPVGDLTAAFMIKYDRNGAFVWALRIDSLTDGDVINSAAILNDSLVVVGQYGPDQLIFYDKNGAKRQQLRYEAGNAGFAVCFGLDGLYRGYTSGTTPDDQGPLILSLGSGNRHEITSSLTTSISTHVILRENGATQLNQYGMIYVVIFVGVFLSAIPAVFTLSIVWYQKFPWELARAPNEPVIESTVVSTSSHESN